MEELEKAVLERRLAEQAIMKEALDAKNARYKELETEVKYLRRLLNEALAVPRPQPQPQPATGAPAGRPGGNGIPTRWRV